MLENQERNWEVHTLKKRRKEIEVERQIQGVGNSPFHLFYSQIYISISDLFTYQSTRKVKKNP